MAIEKSDNITIVGAGMAGTLLAILMARRGFRVDLFEQHPDPRSGDGCLQLCSNLALGERARYALRITGLLRQVEALSTQMRGRLIHDRAGNVTEQPYGYREYETLHSVRRESLQLCLLYEAEKTDCIRVHFDQIDDAVLSPAKKAHIREVLRWYQENHPIWFGWLDLP